jgi:hypothetical protein
MRAEMRARMRADRADPPSALIPLLSFEISFLNASSSFLGVRPDLRLQSALISAQFQKLFNGE